ncbi:NAD-dependent epimerase/dehydratase family protein [Dactylosporangium sp. AC04546]|uniref:NAD-dependent epimerase/dehydratase family protein n=1 Tax=Dactylosporangium sp. AC04546 TaxID=2862460 RepID=UPI003FA406F7
MTRPARVLVTGGTGVLGRELVRRLQDQTEVRVLSRRPSQGPGFVQGDLETGERPARASPRRSTMWMRSPTARVRPTTGDRNGT